MSREGKGGLAAAVVVVLATVLLAACGSSDSSTSTEATTTGSKAAAESNGRGQAQHASQDESKGKGHHSSPQGSQQSDARYPKNVATPLKVSGGGSSQYRQKGGDNSIQEYGDESDESELQEVAEVVHGFLVARAEGKWDTACSYLARANIEQLQQVVSQSSKAGSGSCPKALEAFSRPVSVAVQREITTVDAGSFRHEGERGFLIYRGAEGTVYAMPLVSEDGAWKVTGLAGTAIG